MEYHNKKSCYDDIIGLERPVSTSHPPMDRAKRAAQFSPFAALTGYEDAVEEAGRKTVERIELDDDAKYMLDQNLQKILAMPASERIATITFFQPDERKLGGQYITITGLIKKFNPYEKSLVMQDDVHILLSEILELNP